MRAFYSALLVVSLLPSGANAATREPEIVISLTSGVLLLRGPDGKEEAFPVAVGRRLQGRQLGPRGRWFTGPDPTDKAFYLPRRRLPAFHRGLPFLRLSPVRLRPKRSDAAYERASAQEFGIHGPVTPTLIWGSMTAGCVRMRGPDLRRVFAFAQRHAGVSVRFTRRPLAGLDQRGRENARCAEASLGLRRLRWASLSRPTQGRICGGVDQWFAVELQGGDVLIVDLLTRGPLKLELYGIRGISTVARGRAALRHRVPLGPRSRGARYLRVVAPSKGTWAYSLRLRRLR